MLKPHLTFNEEVYKYRNRKLIKFRKVRCKSYAKPQHNVITKRSELDIPITTISLTK